MSDLPSITLSVRQPWAWAIIHAGKDIENRSAPAARHLSHRGPICIHASLGMTRSEYDWAAEFMAGIGVTCPDPAELLRGGIIGTVKVTDIIKASESRWFFGPRGLQLIDPNPVEFIPCAGRLGYFRWTRNLTGAPDPAKRWMIRPMETANMEGALL